MLILHERVIRLFVKLGAVELKRGKCVSRIESFQILSNVRNLAINILMTFSH